MQTLIQNVKILMHDNETEFMDVLVEDGKIKDIQKHIENFDKEVIDARGNCYCLDLLMFMYIYVNQDMNIKKQFLLVQKRQLMEDLRLSWQCQMFFLSR